MNKTELIGGLLIIGVVLFASSVIALSKYQPIEQENRDLYCEMIEIHEETGGDYGWPPFDGECE